MADIKAPTPAASLMIRAVRGYQALSVASVPRCRFHPTCSQYACEAIAEHGTARGGWLSVRRLSRCHPWGGSGFDPVPQRRSTGPDPSSARGV